MSSPELHPYAGKYKVLYAAPASEGENRRMLAELLECVAYKSIAAGATLIGHIKAYASQPGGGYLKGSVTSAKAPAQLEDGSLQDHEQLNVSLVVLVYGLEAERLEQIVAQTWKELVSKGLLLSVKPLPLHTTHPEHRAAS